MSSSLWENDSMECLFIVPTGASLAGTRRTLGPVLSGVGINAANDAGGAVSLALHALLVPMDDEHVVYRHARTSAAAQTMRQVQTYTGSTRRPVGDARLLSPDDALPALREWFVEASAVVRQDQSIKVVVAVAEARVWEHVLPELDFGAERPSWLFHPKSLMLLRAPSYPCFTVI